MKYTPETTKKLQEDYLAGVQTQQLAVGLGVPERSIISKLAQLGVYRAKVYLTKTGEPTQLKSQLVEEIALALNCNLELLDSLEKVNKNVLKLIKTALAVKE